MHAVVFDVDGTLLRSFGVDGELYTAAVRGVLGSVQIRRTWGDYRNVTDSGILSEILEENGIAADPMLTSAVEQYFVDCVARHIERHGPFEEMPRAREFVLSLLASNDHAVAYATGGWCRSALLKLRSAAFPVDGLPIAGSDVLIERTAIMQHALRQLPGHFDSVTYYGDGKWDKAASEQLGWHFVPVGEALGGISAFEPIGA